MNWGLFLALAGFLLPFAHALRQVLALIVERGGAPGVAAARWIVLLLLCMPVTGKLPAMIYAITGAHGSLSQLTESFLVTGWGWAHLAATAAAVGAIDLLGPRVFAQIRGVRLAGDMPLDWRALAKDTVLASWLLVLAWAAAR